MSKQTGILGNSISNIELLATASSFPERGKWVTNEDIHEYLHGINWKTKMKILGLDPKHYEKKYGFKTRYHVEFPPTRSNFNRLTSADLMEQAGRKILENKNVDKTKISLLIAVSTTTHRYTTSLGAIVAGRLGLACASLEIKSGCSSGIYALVLASQFVKSNKSNVLIVSAETLSKVASKEFLYVAGDGGAAILLGFTKEKNRGIKSYYLDSDGTYSDKMGVPGVLPPTKEALDKGEYFFQSNADINEIIASKWRLIPNLLYKKAKLSPSEITVFIPHQVNNKTIEIAREAANLPKEKVINKVKNYANCGQVSIFLALNDFLQSKKVKVGDYLLLSAVGGGLAWGGIIWRY